MQNSKIKIQNFGSPPQAGRRTYQGFTLIEALVGISVLILAGVAVWSFQKDVLTLGGIFQSDLTIQQEVRKVLKAMSAEVRSASISSTGSYPIAEASTTSFTFYSDTDDDGLKERIRYFLSGNILKKGVLKPGGNPLIYDSANEAVSDVARDVTNGEAPVFEYFDTNYEGTRPALNQPVNVLVVRLVKVTLMVDHYPSRPPGPITLTTQVSIRNLKDNL